MANKIPKSKGREGKVNRGRLKRDGGGKRRQSIRNNHVITVPSIRLVLQIM
jgi:hypothetical protein